MKKSALTSAPTKVKTILEYMLDNGYAKMYQLEYTRIFNRDQVRIPTWNNMNRADDMIRFLEHLRRNGIDGHLFNDTRKGGLWFDIID